MRYSFWSLVTEMLYTQRFPTSQLHPRSIEIACQFALVNCCRTARPNAPLPPTKIQFQLQCDIFVRKGSIAIVGNASFCFLFCNATKKETQVQKANTLYQGLPQLSTFRACLFVTYLVGIKINFKIKLTL